MTPINRLAANTQGLNQRPILVNVTGFQIIQKSSPAPDHFQQTPTGMKVFGVSLKMFRQLVDAFRKQCHLGFGIPGVLRRFAVLRNYLGFLSFGQWHFKNLR
jgi:hypothetical protein